MRGKSYITYTQSLLSVIPQLHDGLKVIAGSYLIWSAAKILLHKPQPQVNESTTPSLTLNQAVLTGLLTQLSNPNTAIVFASLFTTLLDHHFSTTVYFMVPGMTFLIDFLWFTFVALILSQSLPRRFYLRGKVTIDRITAGILGLLGLKLLLK